MNDKEITAYSIYSKKAKNNTKVNPLVEVFPALPNKKYQVIYADPPWDYGGKMQYDKTTIKSENVGFEKDIFISSASFKYPTLKLKELIELDVQSIADDDCMLFMWTTGPQMANSIKLGEAWGFEYKGNIIWEKVRKDGMPDGRGVGFYFRNVTEILLFGIRGDNNRTLAPARSQVNLIRAIKREHSRKPDEIVDLIEKCSPGPYIELFARGDRAGWDMWGNQANEDYEPTWSTYANHTKASDHN